MLQLGYIPKTTGRAVAVVFLTHYIAAFICSLTISPIICIGVLLVASARERKQPKDRQPQLNAPCAV